MKKRWQSLFALVFLLLTPLILLSRYSLRYEVIQHISEIEAGVPIDYNALITSEEGVVITMKHTSVEKTKPGKYQITYELTKNNRVQEKIIYINIIDTTGPEIHIRNHELEYGIEFDPLAEQYATASDVTGPVTELTVTEGTVDTFNAGEYTITYEASDQYGNISRQDVIYTVRQKKYRFDELVDFTRQQVAKMNADGIAIDCVFDETENSLEIQFSDIALYETGRNGGKMIVYPYMLLSEEEQYFSFGLAVVPYAAEIFEGTAGLFISSENGQYEAEQIYEDLWNYENSYYHTILIVEVASDQAETLAAVDKLTSVIESQAVELRLQGSYTAQVDLPADVCQATTRLTRLFTEIYHMYYGTY